MDEDLYNDVQAVNRMIKYVRENKISINFAAGRIYVNMLYMHSEGPEEYILIWKDDNSICIILKNMEIVVKDFFNQRNIFIPDKEIFIEKKKITRFEMLDKLGIVDHLHDNNIDYYKGLSDIEWFDIMLKFNLSSICDLCQVICSREQDIGLTEIYEGIYCNLGSKTIEEYQAVADKYRKKSAYF